MKHLDITVDLRTSRLLKILQAAQLAEEIPTVSAGKLVNLAKAARLLAESNENVLAVRAIDEIRTDVSEIEPIWKVAIESHCDLAKVALRR